MLNQSPDCPLDVGDEVHQKFFSCLSVCLYGIREEIVSQPLFCHKDTEEGMKCPQSDIEWISLSWNDHCGYKTFPSWRVRAAVWDLTRTRWWPSPRRRTARTLTGGGVSQECSGLLFQIVIKWVAHSVATPALLCHKEPAQGTQSSLLGALGRNAPY